MDPVLDYTREASSRYQQVPVSVMLFGSCHLILFFRSTNYIQIVSEIQFYFPTLVFAGAGTGPVQEVERSSSSDKRQTLGKDQD